MFPPRSRTRDVTTPADFSGQALNVIPSGQYGGLPIPAGANTQLKMYDALTPLAGNVTDADLLADFKSEKLGTPGSPAPTVVETTPRAGVTIVRDANDVPHIYGVTDDDVVWAAGWVLAEDRSLLLAFGRTPGRLAALDAPGIDAFSLVAGARGYEPTAQADNLINQEQTAALNAQGAAGKALLHDIDVYIDGHQRASEGGQLVGQAVHARRHLLDQRTRGPAVRPGRRRRGPAHDVLQRPADQARQDEGPAGVQRPVGAARSRHADDHHASASPTSPFRPTRPAT